MCVCVCGNILPSVGILEGGYTNQVPDIKPLSIPERIIQARGGGSKSWARTIDQGAVCHFLFT